MKTYTIGFTQKPAQRFFELIRKTSTKRLIDVRINNVSQLAGFAKRDDLKFFLKEICGVDYLHMVDLAPTKPMLDDYKKKEIEWAAYEDRFLNLMAQRHIERSLKKEVMEDACLLCSEHKPHHCHRRLVVEYLNQHWGSEIDVVHLV